MDTLAIVLVVLGAVLLVILWTGVRVVRQATAVTVERLGKYRKTLETGVHIILPIFDRTSAPISLKEIVADFKPQPVITKDNVTMQIDTVVYFQITDAKLYTYGVDRPLSAIENLTATTLRNIVGELELDETLTSRDTVNSKMRIFSTKRPILGESRSTVSNSRIFFRPKISRRRWKSKCVPSVKDVRRSFAPRERRRVIYS